MHNKQKLANPFFVAAVITLLLNDWYFKYAFHNALTGKLSDIAGLFALPFFLSTFWLRGKHGIYIGTALVFILWKSPLAQPLIDSINGIGIPVNRVVDLSDCWALLVLPVSYYAFHQSSTYQLKPMLTHAIMVTAAFAFVATSMPKGKYTTFANINKTYSFNFSKRELVSRINALQLDYVKDMQTYTFNRNIVSGVMQPDTARLDFDSKANIFYYTITFSKKKDTLAQILDYEQLKDADTIRLRTMFSKINISGDNARSEIKLLSLNNYVQLKQKGDARERAIGIFERYVIKKIRKYGK
ncbi:hypothetical protein [Mucilaginibacter pedocola]|uniref:Uncharacterized protein n=1 Tax=Mucilaginibacter pedocola TaxID=1792845 RepID=A0A1S9PCA5_9SPHI|nr:hypothetical protein [Mucilaginibacter pedocola]OOQ58218.1 hypothetical protein BC343_11275 [Mucilaginibacter pedocola]